MNCQDIACDYARPILKIKLPTTKLMEIVGPPPSDTSPKKESPPKTMSKSSLGSSWTEADIQQLWDLRQAKKSWSQIGMAINRTGGAAQQQWMRMQREKHPLLTNDGAKTPIITKEPKEEAPSDQPDGKCQVCGKFGFVDDGEMVRCSKCAGVYHQSCHEPPVAKEFFENTRTPWHCRACSESEASIGSILAESLHTALERKSSKKQKKRRRSTSIDRTAIHESDIRTTPGAETAKLENKRQRTASVANPGEEDAPEQATMSQELKSLQNQIDGLEKDKLAMQEKLDQVMASQNNKGTEMEELKEAIEGLKATLTERQPSSPLNGWLSKAKKRVTGFGGT